jgi:DNA-binding NarL/FixJ family response regulator
MESEIGETISCGLKNKSLAQKLQFTHSFCQVQIRNSGARLARICN